ncbi:response regulator [Gillisia sp. M10.2A]|uniref:Response regulator n=1 Tax=Gillisia lutea TaxID=2909668 RepID=A0ABS9EID0_9FLAO|nr:response regulator [Gillisia lutea]MCF4102538.1 response regulator [Gillisia lutea]
MTDKTKILIVEDDMIIAANISLQLTNLGYEITGIVCRGEDAILHVQENKPDILLLDIHLKGKLDGIETAKLIQSKNELSLIYLTANSDDATFSIARETHPMAFISKPLNLLELKRAIELVEAQVRKHKQEKEHRDPEIEFMDDRIFVRQNGKRIKLLLKFILYIEAERNYCNVVTEEKSYLLSSTLKSISEQLPTSLFIRVHRSYVINISRLDVVAESHIEIKRKVIPVSKTYREVLLKRIKTI